MASSTTSITPAAGVCQHKFKLLRSETSLVQFTCSADAKHSTDMVYQCELCKTKLCSSCVAKAEKKKMAAEREAAGMACGLRCAWLARRRCSAGTLTRRAMEAIFRAYDALITREQYDNCSVVGRGWHVVEQDKWLMMFSINNARANVNPIAQGT
ncbi:hypothetical protein LTR56_005386 [Elasticomyces elasticus]|nr:hypothetical protein LTR56_005386 [Elasticomyces elasticus]KAK4927773.1 hypothetical protein LTR49_005398 [Elasticomyces elasticus]